MAKLKAIELIIILELFLSSWMQIYKMVLSNSIQFTISLHNLLRIFLWISKNLSGLIVILFRSESISQSKSNFSFMNSEKMLLSLPINGNGVVLAATIKIDVSNHTRTKSVMELEWMLFSVWVSFRKLPKCNQFKINFVYRNWLFSV